MTTAYDSPTHMLAGAQRPGQALSDPASVMRRLTEIEREIAIKGNELEDAAFEWFQAKREKERAYATAFLSAVGTVAERSAIAARVTALDGSEAEARFESLKALCRVLETRASIGQSILRAQGRV